MSLHDNVLCKVNFVLFSSWPNWRFPRAGQKRIWKILATRNVWKRCSYEINMQKGCSKFQAVLHPKRFFSTFLLDDSYILFHMIKDMTFFQLTFPKPLVLNLNIDVYSSTFFFTNIIYIFLLLTFGCLYQLTSCLSI